MPRADYAQASGLPEEGETTRILCNQLISVNDGRPEACA